MISSNCILVTSIKYDDVLELSSFTLPKLVYTDGNNSLGREIYYKGLDSTILTSYDAYLFTFDMIQSCFERMRYSSHVKPMIKECLQQMLVSMNVCIQPLAVMYAVPSSRSAPDLVELQKLCRRVLTYVSNANVAPELTVWVKLAHDISCFINAAHMCPDTSQITEHLRNMVDSMKFCDVSLMDTFSDIVTSFATQLLVCNVTKDNKHILANSRVVTLPYDSLDAASLQSHVCGHGPSLSDDWSRYIEQEIAVMTELMKQRRITLESNGLVAKRSRQSCIVYYRTLILLQNTIVTFSTPSIKFASTTGSTKRC